MNRLRDNIHTLSKAVLLHGTPATATSLAMLEAVADLALNSASLSGTDLAPIAKVTLTIDGDGNTSTTGPLLTFKTYPRGSDGSYDGATSYAVDTDTYATLGAIVDYINKTVPSVKVRIKHGHRALSVTGLPGKNLAETQLPLVGQWLGVCYPDGDVAQDIYIRMAHPESPDHGSFRILLLKHLAGTAEAGTFHVYREMDDETLEEVALASNALDKDAYVTAINQNLQEAPVIRGPIIFKVTGNTNGTGITLICNYTVANQ